MTKPHISYVPLEQMDERMQEEMHRCAREGTEPMSRRAFERHRVDDGLFEIDGVIDDAMYLVGVGGLEQLLAGHDL